MRPRPNLHPFIAKKIGIRMMYAPPFRPAHHAFRPIRPLVVRCARPFAGVMLYCANRRRDLRLRFIIDVVRLLFGLALLIPLSLLVGTLITDLRWMLISLIPQTFIAVGLAHSDFCRPLYVNFANCWMRRFPHA